MLACRFNILCYMNFDNERAVLQLSSLQRSAGLKHFIDKVHGLLPHNYTMCLGCCRLQNSSCQRL